MLPIYLMAMEYNEPSDIEKLTYLYEKYKDLMYRVAFKILKDDQLAEDAVQEAFLSVTKCLQKINISKRNKTRNFLIIISRNAALKIYNDRKNIVLIDDEKIDKISDVNGLEMIQSKENYDRTFEIIKSMKTKYCEVILLKYYYGLSYSEIAASLNISIDNVKIRLYRAKNQLKKLLMEDSQND